METCASMSIAMPSPGEPCDANGAVCYVNSLSCHTGLYIYTGYGCCDGTWKVLGDVFASTPRDWTCADAMPASTDLDAGR
jgi:hypothetical protein